MEKIAGNQFHGLSNAVKKKRSQTSRRPHPSSQAFAESSSQSSLSSNTNDLNKGSSDANAAWYANSESKGFNLDQFVSQASSVLESERYHMKIKRDGGYTTFHNSDSGWSGSHNKQCSEGVLATANWKSSSKLKDGLETESSVAVHGRGSAENLNSEQSGVLQHVLGNENGMKKLKLKVGGFSCTIKADSSSNDTSKGRLPVKSFRHTDAARPHKNFLGYLDDSRSPSDKRNCLRGIPWKDFSKYGFTFEKEYSVMGKLSGKNTSGKHGDKSEPTRKSKRVVKKRVLDGEFSDGDNDDDEIRYMEKLKTSKVSTVYRNDEESSKKHRKLSNIDCGPSKLGNDANKKSISDKCYEDADYEEEDSGSDGELEGKKKQKQKKEFIDSLMDSKREMTLTTRQRALQSSKDSSATRESLIEFPNGLPTAPSKKQKEKLSEVEQQLKKSEAAQRRRMQVEKAARESEAEAIRKILGQDSSRKKREEKIKKRQEALAQERAANAMMLAPNSVRLVMRPAGTVVIFSEDIGLPSIFDSKPCSYPCPRENCAGPSCTNPYKYRDSRSRLPLCSLQCYKAIQEKIVAEVTC